jgi:hypothetical protein
VKENRLYNILRIILALVFAISAATKLIAPGLLEIILVDHGITATRASAAIITRLLIGFEFSLALLLLQKNYLKRIILPAVLLFLAAFTIYLVYAQFVLNDNQNCGCFGAVVRMSPVESIIKNIFLMALTIFLYRKEEKGSKKKIIPLILFFISFPIVFALTPIKSDSSFPFNKFTEFAGAGRTDLAEGEKLIFLFSLDCDHCQQTAREIVELKKKYTLPEIYVLFFQEAETTVKIFTEKTGFSAPYKILSGEEFFDLIGTNPPRCYRVKNGKVLEFWDEKIKERLGNYYNTSKFN